MSDNVKDGFDKNMDKELEKDFDEDIGENYVTIVDDDGSEYELQYLDTLDYNGSTYHAYLPADMDEDDEDYGLIILRSYFNEENEELLESVDDDALLNEVYEQFLLILDDDEEGVEATEEK